jgi:hypothetical protein
MPESAEALVERIADFQRRKLGQMVDEFQREPDGANAPTVEGDRENGLRRRDPD